MTMKFRVVQTCKMDGCDRPLLLPTSRESGRCCVCRDDLHADVDHLRVVPSPRVEPRNTHVKERPVRVMPKVRVVIEFESDPLDRDEADDLIDRLSKIAFMWSQGRPAVRLYQPEPTSSGRIPDDEAV